MNDDLKFICDIDNAIEAEYLSNLFDSNMIRYHLKSYYDLAYNGLYVATKGYGKLYVLSEFEMEAKELYLLYKKSLPENE